MIINKYTGKTEEEAKAKAREEMGPDVVIMNIKEIKPKGITGVFKSSTYEVTAAIEDDQAPRNPFAQTPKQPQQSAQPQQRPTSTFSAVADDDLGALRDVFSAVNEVLEKQEEVTYSNPVTTPRPAPKPAPQPAPKQPAPQPAFEPLSDAAPKARIIEPTYSRPQNMPLTPQVNPNPGPNITSNPMPELAKSKPEGKDNIVFVKMLYNVLLDNEVSEKYINQVLEDMDRILATNHSLDNLLSNVYQKMVLKLGTPAAITPGTKKPKVVFFIGPTGVGKTTTIAKIASKFWVDEGKKVGLITADTYRMAAANQLQTYASILEVPLQVIYSADELADTVKKLARENPDMDLILVDTVGFSHKNEQQKADTSKLVSCLEGIYDSQVYLVLSATTKYKDLVSIVDSYSSFTDYNLIFTKLDETSCLGNLFNIKLHTGAPLSYVTCGQNVPEDIEIVNAQKLVKQLLGGN